MTPAAPLLFPGGTTVFFWKWGIWAMELKAQPSLFVNLLDSAAWYPPNWCGNVLRVWFLPESPPPHPTHRHPPGTQTSAVQGAFCGQGHTGPPRATQHLRRDSVIMNEINEFYFLCVHFNSSMWLPWGSRLGGGTAATLTSWGAGGWGRGTVLVPDKGQHSVPTLVGTLRIHPSAGALPARTGSWLNCNASNIPQSPRDVAGGPGQSWAETPEAQLVLVHQSASGVTWGRKNKSRQTQQTRLIKPVSVSECTHVFVQSAV